LLYSDIKHQVRFFFYILSVSYVMSYSTSFVHVMNSADPSGRLLAGIAGSNHAVGHRRLFVVNFECCQIEVSTMDRTLVPANRTERGVSECDPKISTMRWSWSQQGCCATGGKNNSTYSYCILRFMRTPLNIKYFFFLDQVNSEILQF
jgi:hypothetical protein